MRRAIPAINPAGIRITATKATVRNGATGDTNAAINPKIVMGATKGAASRFATMLIGDK